MIMRRREMLAAAAASALPFAAAAQQRAMRIVVPYPPGGGADMLARAFAAHVGPRIGRTIVVENRPGATGTIGALAVARAAPDGDTVLQADSAPMSIQPLANRLSYGPEDFQPVARLVTSPVVLATRREARFCDLADVVAQAKADPGRITYATSGILSHFHLAIERFAQLADIELTHVPFQGTAPGIVAAIAGQVDLVAAPPASLQDQGSAAQLRPIASMTETPVPELPGTPTFRESGIALVFEGWRGLFLPRGASAAVIAALERATLQAFAETGFVEQAQRIGETPAPLGAEAFARFWAADRATVQQLLPRLPRN